MWTCNNNIECVLKMYLYGYLYFSFIKMIVCSIKHSISIYCLYQYTFYIENLHSKELLLIKNTVHGSYSKISEEIYWSHLLKFNYHLFPFNLLLNLLSIILGNSLKNLLKILLKNPLKNKSSHLFKLNMTKLIQHLIKSL